MNSLSPLLQGTMLVLVLAAAAVAQAAPASCPAGYKPFTGKDYENEEARAGLPQVLRSLPLMLGVEQPSQGFFNPGLTAAVKVTHDKGRLFFQARGQQGIFSAGMENEIERLCYNPSGRFTIHLLKARGETQARTFAGRASGSTVFLAGMPGQQGEVPLAKLTSAGYDRLIGRVAYQPQTTRAYASGGDR